MKARAAQPFAAEAARLARSEARAREIYRRMARRLWPLFLLLLLLAAPSAANAHAHRPAEIKPLAAGFAGPWWTLAQLPTLSPTEIGLLLCGLATLAVIYRQLRGLKSSLAQDIRRELLAEQAIAAEARTPQPLVVAEAVKHVTVTEFAELHRQIIPREKIEGDFARLNADLTLLRGDEAKTHAAVGELRDLVETRFNQLDHKRSSSIAMLHQHLSATKDNLQKDINETKVQVAAVEAKAAAVVQTCHALDAKIDRLRENPPRRQ